MNVCELWMPESVPVSYESQSVQVEHTPGPV